MKIFFALFISFACAAEFPELKGKTIERTSTSRFDQLDSDTFYCIMSFLSAEEVLSLRFLSRGIYRRMRNLWPEMKLFTIVDISCPGRSVDFSHVVEIHGLNNLEDQVLTYTRAQLSCIRKFTFKGKGVRNLQAVIDFLPRDSLTSLRLINTEFTWLLIGKIDFPKLIHLELNYISVNSDTFNLLPNCMRVMKIIDMDMNTITSSLLATALGTLDRLKVLSLSFCEFSKNSLSTIFENLPTSLKRLNIDFIVFHDFESKLLEPGLKRLREIEYLQEINFFGVSNEFTTEIILNLPKCITSIQCSMIRETLNAFQQRSGKFKNVKKIYLPSTDHVELYPTIQKLFPSLNEDIKKELNNPSL